jgi:hypothetical protein
MGLHGKYSPILGYVIGDFDEWGKHDQITKFSKLLNWGGRFGRNRRNWKGEADVADHVWSLEEVIALLG